MDRHLQKTTSIRLPEMLKLEAVEQAKINNQTLNDYIIYCIQNDLDKN